MSTSAHDQFRDEFLPKWDQLFSQLFPIAVPSRAEWRDLQQMIRVLSLAVPPQVESHIFFPDTGGDHLTGAVAAHENGLLELRCGDNIKIVSPRALACETFPDNSEWSYFRLETNSLTPSVVNGGAPCYEFEELDELSPGEYCDRSGRDDNRMGYDDNGNVIQFPRVVSRQLGGGAFVIFCNRSRFKENPQSYNAGHNSMSAEQFRNDIASRANQTR